MYCPNCGTQNPDEAAFCQKCRSAMDGSDVIHAPVKKGQPLWVRILLCVVIFAAASLLGKYVLAPMISGGGVQTQNNKSNISADADSYAVHAIVPAEWSDVSIWAWSDTEGNVFEAWPGERMVQDTEGWYTYNVPNWCNYVIINGWEGAVQTPDILVERREAWLVVNEDLSHQLSYTKPVGLVESKQKDTISIYVQVPVDWDDIRIWAWSNVEGDAFESWPGEAMTEMNDGWYYYEVPNWCTHFIVNGWDGTVQSMEIPIDEENEMWLGISGEPAAESDAGNQAYYDVFTSRGLVDESLLSPQLASFSGVKLVEGNSIMKMEFGYQDDVIIEGIYTFYYDIAAFDNSEKALFESTMCSNFVSVDSVSGASWFYQDLGNYYRVTICYTQMDDVSVLQKIAELGLGTWTDRTLSAEKTIEDMAAGGFIFK